MVPAKKTDLPVTYRCHCADWPNYFSIQPKLFGRSERAAARNPKPYFYKMKITSLLCAAALAQEAQDQQGDDAAAAPAAAADTSGYGQAETTDGNYGEQQESYGAEAEYGEAPKVCFSPCPPHAPCRSHHSGACQPRSYGVASYGVAQESRLRVSTRTPLISIQTSSIILSALVKEIHITGKLYLKIVPPWYTTQGEAHLSCLV